MTSMAINDKPTTFYFVVSSTALYGIWSAWLKAEYIDKIIFDRNSCMIWCLVVDISNIAYINWNDEISQIWAKTPEQKHLNAILTLVQRKSYIYFYYVVHRSMLTF